MSKIKEKMKEFQESGRRHPAKRMRTFLIFMVAGYVLFFASPMWYPEKQDLVEPTPYYQQVQYSNYSMYLTQCTYSSGDQTIQIILELSNQDVVDKRLEFEAVERTNGRLKISPVYEDPSYVILQITEVPPFWKEISIRVKEQGEDAQAKLYTNVNDIEKVTSLTAHTDTEYQILRLQAQIQYDNAQIQQKEKEIAELELANEEISTRIESLQSEVYPTEQEAAEAEEIIKRADGTRTTNLGMIAQKQEEIKTLQIRSKNIEIQMKELETQ